jgi:hypothetical protein
MMQLAFKRASGIVGKLIDLFSGRDGFCHVELVFSDGVSFSSTTMDPGEGDNGTRLKRIAYNHPEEWDFIALPMIGAEDERAIRAYAEQLARENQGYDYRGALHHAFPWIKHSRRKDYCNEVVIKALQHRNYFPLLVGWELGPNEYRREAIAYVKAWQLKRHLEAV